MPLAPDNLHALAATRTNPHDPRSRSRWALADCHALSRHLHQGAYSLRSVHTTEGGGSLRHHHGAVLHAAWDLSRRLLWRSYGRRLYALARLLIYTCPGSD